MAVTVLSLPHEAFHHENHFQNNPWRIFLLPSSFLDEVIVIVVIKSAKPFNVPLRCSLTSSIGSLSTDRALKAELEKAISLPQIQRQEMIKAADKTFSIKLCL